MHVGSTNDVDAFETSDLKKLNESLPFPYHWVGDGAYVCTETMITPFPGVNLHVDCPPEDWFNFYQSQLRITVERLFGIYIMRWGIFWCPLKHDLENALVIVHACVRLHNFAVQRKLPYQQRKYVPPPHVRLDSEGRLIDDVWRNPKPIAPVRCSSCLRDHIRDRLRNNPSLRRNRSHHGGVVVSSFV
jgi:hypothetical protein